MDSYEKLRKMNELSKELRQRGFADSSIDAIRQAQEIFGSEDAIINKETTDPEQNNTFTEKMPKMEFEQFSHMLRANEQFKKSISDQVLGLTKDLTSCIDKINEIVRKMNELEGKISSVKGMTMSQERAEPRPEPRTEHREEPRREEPKKEGQYNQRIGNFTEDDVSIDKVFYMGKR